jgi:hypothetical protein
VGVDDVGDVGEVSCAVEFFLVNRKVESFVVLAGDVSSSCCGGEEGGETDKDGSCTDETWFEGNEGRRLGEDAPLCGLGLRVVWEKSDGAGEVGAVLGMNRTSLGVLSSIGGEDGRRTGKRNRTEIQARPDFSTLGTNSTRHINIT